MPRAQLVETTDHFTVDAVTAAAAYCWISGINRAVLPLAAGAATTPAKDPMYIRDYVVTIQRAGVIVPGIQVAICALNGQRGTEWLRLVQLGNQGRGYRIQLARPAITQFGICFLTVGGTVADGDEISVRLCYEPIAIR